MFGLDIVGDVARLTLGRPDARNAIPASQWLALAAAVERAVEAQARLILLSGTGPAFCAGADTTDFAAMHGDEQAAATFRRTMRAGLDALADAPIPTVALVHGPCYGAGVALALACDLRIAGPAAAFAITPAKFGISFPQEDVHRLVLAVGGGQAKRLLLTGSAIDAAEAHRIGLVELLAEDVEAEGTTLAAALIACSADSQSVLKRAVALARAGIASDAEQDRRFDALLASDELARRLPDRRPR